MEKKKKRFNAQTYSTKYLKDHGYAVQNVEQTIRHPSKNTRRDERGRPLDWEMFKRDLWNFADLIAVKIGESGCLFVQTTTHENAEARMQKIAGIVEVRTILQAGNRIHVHGWKQTGGKKGVPKKRHLVVNQITFDEDGLMEVETLDSTSITESDDQGEIFATKEDDF